MRILIQRVSSASVNIHQEMHSAIGKGFLVLVGIEAEDHLEDIEWVTNKIGNIRLFDDAAGVMNLNIQEMKGDLLLVSQFTLHASTKKGNRPSYIQAAKPEIAVPIYEKLIQALETKLGKKIATGVFGADMQINLVNDGPVTIWMDSKQRQ